jgi:hypothetical protein
VASPEPHALKYAAAINRTLSYDLPQPRPASPDTKKQHLDILQGHFSFSSSDSAEDELPMPEPFKIKMVECIVRLPKVQREQKLKASGYNVFGLRSSEVFIDLLTDSGTSAMSDVQWANMMNTPQSYAGELAMNVCLMQGSVPCKVALYFKPYIWKQSRPYMSASLMPFQCHSVFSCGTLQLGLAVNIHEFIFCTLMPMKAKSLILEPSYPLLDPSESFTLNPLFNLWSPHAWTLTLPGDSSSSIIPKPS